MDYVWIGLGGILGANMRFALGRWFTRRWETTFPLGTFVINITGAFVIGFLMALLGERFISDPRWRLFAVVGFLGSYTTFSTFTYDIYQLADRSQWSMATLYLVGSNLVGVAGCVAGVALGKAVAAS
jgi:CrcB protein